MEIHQLRYFCAAAETSSFTRGAGRECVTQPTLSQQLIKLERELGTKLFDRLRHRVRLTESGRIFLRSAKSILSKISEAREEVQRSSREPSGSITVGATPTLALCLLSPVIRNLRRSHSSIKVRVVEDSQVHLLPALSDGMIDFALVGLPVAGQEFRSGEIMKQSLVVAVPNVHPLAKRRRVRLTELRNDSFLLLHQRFPFRDRVWEMLRKARIQPEVAFEGSSIATILGMVSEGAGVSLVPEMVVARRKGCRFIPLADSQASFQVGWAMLRDRVPSPAQRLLIRTLTTVSQRHMLCA
jgi:LysR family transcriptional regulator, hydrogen peroxide-inducible genes activator